MADAFNFIEKIIIIIMMMKMKMIFYLCCTFFFNSLMIDDHSFWVRIESKWKRRFDKQVQSKRKHLQQKNKYEEDKSKMTCHYVAIQYEVRKNQNERMFQVKDDDSNSNQLAIHEK